MYTFESLKNELINTTLNRKGTLLIHSSMKAIGSVEGGADTVLDVLSYVMKDGLLLLPTHSWDEKNLKDNVYDVNNETSCVGLLSNMFLKRENVKRSLHPTHSVAALGSRSEEYVNKDRLLLSQEKVTPCSRYGCFGSLYDERAQILFLGAPLTTNTFIHSVEEWLDIPDRLRETTRDITVIDDEQKRTKVNLVGHYNTFGDVSKNYDKLENALIVNGIAKKFMFGDAKCYLVQVREMADLVISFLQRDPDLFVDKREIPTSWYEK